MVFIPGATVDYTIARLEDYNGHKDIFKPEVIDSRTLSHSGNDYLVYLRLVKKKVVTVVLDTEFDVHYTRHDGSVVVLPCCNVFRIRDGLISEYRSYVDATPVYAP